jgi:lysophospholipase L1-like esterase
MVVAPHFGGGWLRVHLSNRFGTSPVVLDRVEIALRASGRALVPGSRRAVRFGGRRVVRIPAGADVVSDPVRLRFAAFQDLAVSVYVAGSIAHPTEHLVTRQTSYLTPPGSGDHVSDRIGEAFTGLTAVGGYSTGWYFLDGIDVRAARRVGAVVALGDSITDGFESNENALTESPAGLNQNGRWPDDLARRLLRAHRQLSVLNAGISGNRVLMGNPLFGPSALTRLQDDVIDEAGVRDVIVLEGINDIGLSPSPSPSSIIGGLKRAVVRLRAAHLHVLLGTLTPAEGTPLTSYGGVAANGQREQVNHWIRSQHMVQVVDFDKAVRDPRHPDRLFPRYDDGDHLHLSLAGYRAMAAAVDLAELR